MMEKNNLFENLKKDCARAAEIRCEQLVFEALGESKMALMLGAITEDEFYEIHKILLDAGAITKCDDCFPTWSFDLMK